MTLDQRSGSVPAMAEDKRARLLEAGEAVFVERGIGQATVDEITSRAGVAKGTFYLYFKSKDDLVAALERRLWEGHVALAHRAAEELAAGDWWTVVEAFLERVVDYDLAHGDWHRIVAQAPTPPPDPAEQVEAEIISLIQAAIELGMQQGACHASDPVMAATLLYRAVQGASHQFCRADEPPDRQRFLSTVQELVHKFLARPSG